MVIEQPFPSFTKCKFGTQPVDFSMLYLQLRSFHAVAIENADIYTYAHVVCLAERKDARIIRAFRQVAEALEAKREKTD
jgi:hypothetical protein